MKFFIQEIRLEKKLSIAALARLSHLSVSVIYECENGNRMPRIDTLCKIAKALDVPCESLYSCE